MNHHMEEDLPRVYKLFDRDHDRLRTELMTSLKADWEPTVLPRHRSDSWRRGARWFGLATSLAACLALVILGRSRSSGTGPAAVRASVAPGDLASVDPFYVILENSSEPQVETAVCNILPLFNPS